MTDKTSDNQPDFRVMSQGIEIGAGWQRTGEASGKPYVSPSVATPLARSGYKPLIEFGNCI